MPFGPVRRWFLLFVLGAFLCAGIAQPARSAGAAPMGAMAAMSMAMDMGDTGNVSVPCKSDLPNCSSCIGSVFMAALPPAHTLAATPLTWSRIVYASVTASRVGTSLKPDLGPPIHG